MHTRRPLSHGWYTHSSLVTLSCQSHSIMPHLSSWLTVKSLASPQNPPPSCCQAPSAMARSWRCHLQLSSRAVSTTSGCTDARCVQNLAPSAYLRLRVNTNLCTHLHARPHPSSSPSVHLWHYLLFYLKFIAMFWWLIYPAALQEGRRLAAGLMASSPWEGLVVDLFPAPATRYSVSGWADTGNNGAHHWAFVHDLFQCFYSLRSDWSIRWRDSIWVTGGCWCWGVKAAVAVRQHNSLLKKQRSLAAFL